MKQIINTVLFGRRKSYIFGASLTVIGLYIGFLFWYLIGNNWVQPTINILVLIICILVGLNIDHFTRTVTDTNGNKIHLTAKEFDLLHFLSSHKGQVFTKEQIYENVWGYDNAPDASNLSSFIRKLRLKIEPYPDNPRYIITVWGVGYKFSGEEKP